MRELVYLSDRKLEQFLPTLRSFWPRPKINVKAELVEISLDPALDAEKNRLKQLARVIAHIEKSARWFLDPPATAGQWVHFEAPLNYLVVNRDNGDQVFFVDRSFATTDYPTGGTTRLILHCSGAHLRTENRPLRLAAPPGDNVTIDDGSGAGVFTADNIELLLRTLSTQRQPSDQDHRPPPAAWVEHLPTATTKLLHAIDARLYPETAAWMAGYARITASFAVPTSPLEGTARYIIASPLYIEYAKPPTAEAY